MLPALQVVRGNMVYQIAVPAPNVSYFSASSSVHISKPIGSSARGPEKEQESYNEILIDKLL